MGGGVGAGSPPHPQASFRDGRIPTPLFTHDPSGARPKLELWAGFLGPPGKVDRNNRMRASEIEAGIHFSQND